MAFERLDAIQDIVVGAEVIAITLRALQQFGAYGCEGLVLWVGHVTGQKGSITEVIVPDQSPIQSEDGVGYFVEGGTLFKLNRHLAATGLRLIAQVHSHPNEAYHSDTDDRYAIVTADGGLSLVVPDFGKAPADPTLWAVYRLREGSWQELSGDEIRGLLHIIQ